MSLFQFIHTKASRRCLRNRWARYSSSSSSSSSATAVDAAEKVDSKDGDDDLPFLHRPLGVLEPPSTYRKTLRDKTTELMDQDVRLQQRKHIIKEAAKGYYSDLNATRKHGGKTWIAPRTLIREDHSLYFPDIAGVTLNKKQGTVHTSELCADRVSVVAMLSTVVSEEHVDSFVRRTNEAFLFNPHYRFIQINLQENVMKAFLVSLYVSSLRRKVPKELHSTYLLSSQNMEYVREPLAMNNKHIGFVYLLDQQQRVRWAGGGLAREEESESLLKCVKVLLGRVKESSPL